MPTKIEAHAVPEQDVQSVLRRLDILVADGLRGLGGRKDGEPIRELHLELTHRCNLRCVMCHHWEMQFKDPASVKREMGLEQIRKLVGQSCLLDGVRTVVVSGGEPMLHADFDLIMACLAGRFPDAELTVLTNLWNEELVRRRVSALREHGVSKLSLGSSLDGLAETHDSVRGRQGAFQRLVETAGMLRRDFPQISFGFNFTVIPRNCRELWPAYRFVTEDLGAWFCAQLVVNHQGYEAPETFQWKPAQLHEVADQIDRILADICRKNNALEHLVRGEERQYKWLWERLLYWRYLQRYALKPKRFFKDCMAGQRFAMFDPEGNLFYCPVNKHRFIGNVLEKPLDLLWTSQKAAEERAYVDSCRCDCWLNCISNPILERLMTKALDSGS